MNPRYSQVALRAGHRCEYCRAPEAVFNFPFEVEHIINEPSKLGFWLDIVLHSPLSEWSDGITAKSFLLNFQWRKFNLWKGRKNNGSKKKPPTLSVEGWMFDVQSLLIPASPGLR